jgi:hypothetical protein
MRGPPLEATDDTTALKTGTQIVDVITEVNNEPKWMAAWFGANKMARNVSKTK